MISPNMRRQLLERKTARISDEIYRHYMGFKYYGIGYINYGFKIEPVELFKDKAGALFRKVDFCRYVPYKKS